MNWIAKWMLNKFTINIRTYIIENRKTVIVVRLPGCPPKLS